MATRWVHTPELGVRLAPALPECTCCSVGFGHIVFQAIGTRVRFPSGTPNNAHVVQLVDALSREGRWLQVRLLS